MPFPYLPGASFSVVNFIMGSKNTLHLNLTWSLSSNTGIAGAEMDVGR
jgi:hypothetical protein